MTGESSSGGQTHHEGTGTDRNIHGDSQQQDHQGDFQNPTAHPHQSADHSGGERDGEGKQQIDDVAVVMETAVPIEPSLFVARRSARWFEVVDHETGGKGNDAGKNPNQALTGETV